jgi:REP element-mobilizing transposase RayT
LRKTKAIQYSGSKPQGHELRKGRFSEPNRIYFVTFVIRGRQPVFRNFDCARELIRLINTEHRVRSLAFVVMPDHVHWLLELVGSAPLAYIIRSVKGRSAHIINRNMCRSGPLWQAGFHDHGVRREESLIDIARYIVANPLRAGLVDRIGEYPHWDAVWL